MASTNFESSDLSEDQTATKIESSVVKEEQNVSHDGDIKQDNLNNGDNQDNQKPNTENDNQDDENNDDNGAENDNGDASDQGKAVVNSNSTEDDDVDTNSRLNDSNNNDMLNDSSDDTEKTNLIVNYLPQHMTDEEFEELFTKFGTMKSCKIVRNRSTGYSYGFGFVDFETHEQAIQAINELNGHELENKKIKVAFARPAGQDIKQANLYVKNIPPNWSTEDVRRVFEPFGNIIQVRVLGNARGVAFVLYDLRKQAEDALKAMNGKKLDECESPFEIKFAADKKVEGKSSGNASGASKSNNNNSSGGTGSGPSQGGKSGRRERGNRGGRNRNRDPSKQRGGSSGGQRQGNQQRTSFFDRQRDDRRGGQYNTTSTNNNNNNNNMNNGFGPVRQQANRMNRYAPFVPVQQQPSMAGVPGTTMAAPMAPAAAYGYPSQQPLMPTYMMTANHQTAMMQPTMMHPTITQAAPGQPAPQMQMNPYGAYQPIQPGSYTPVTQNAMNNIYSVASNTMQNAAQMQPQLGQPMNMRQQQQGSMGGYSDDGVTLFVYNIGPQSDEDELRQMFSPYGQVVKCNVVRKSPGGETKGFGFVTLKNKDQANSAIAGLNGSMKNGRTLQVSLKK